VYYLIEVNKECLESGEKLNSLINKSLQLLDEENATIVLYCIEEVVVKMFNHDILQIKIAFEKAGINATEKEIAYNIVLNKIHNSADKKMALIARLEDFNIESIRACKEIGMPVFTFCDQEKLLEATTDLPAKKV